MVDSFEIPQDSQVKELCEDVNKETARAEALDQQMAYLKQQHEVEIADLQKERKLLKDKHKEELSTLQSRADGSENGNVEGGVPAPQGRVRRASIVPTMNVQKRIRDGNLKEKVVSRVAQAPSASKSAQAPAEWTNEKKGFQKQIQSLQAEVKDLVQQIADRYIMMNSGVVILLSVDSQHWLWYHAGLCVHFWLGWCCAFRNLCGAPRDAQAALKMASEDEVSAKRLAHTRLQEAVQAVFDGISSSLEHPTLTVPEERLVADAQYRVADAILTRLSTFMHNLARASGPDVGDHEIPDPDTTVAMMDILSQISSFHRELTARQGVLRAAPVGTEAAKTLAVHDAPPTRAQPETRGAPGRKPGVVSPGAGRRDAGVQAGNGDLAREEGRGKKRVGCVEEVPPGLEGEVAAQEGEKEGKEEGEREVALEGWPGTKERARRRRRLREAEDAVGNFDWLTGLPSSHPEELLGGRRPGFFVVRPYRRGGRREGPGGHGGRPKSAPASSRYLLDSGVESISEALTHRHVRKLRLSRVITSTPQKGICHQRRRVCRTPPAWSSRGLSYGVQSEIHPMRGHMTAMKGLRLRRMPLFIQEEVRARVEARGKEMREAMREVQKAYRRTCDELHSSQRAQRELANVVADSRKMWLRALDEKAGLQREVQELRGRLHGMTITR
eukprot:evm.model.scf_1391EXC.2 EVM.evm.TU.scf_1391EXC.2   scf_1391EXC:32916-39186(-)